MTLKTLLAALATAALFVTNLASAQSLIVDASAIERAAERNAIVWDARSADDYAAGHIPGAVNMGAAGDMFRDPNREDPPSAAVASRLFGAAGMDILGRDVIVYSTRGDPYAYFAARMVEYYGGRHAKVFHGGIDEWKAAGKPVTAEPTRPAPVVLALPTERAGTLWTNEVIEKVRAGGSQIVDVRTPKEFAGEDIRAIRGGHIAGAVSIPYEQNWRDPATPAKLAAKQVKSNDGMSLKPMDDLKALYAKLDPAKETVVYCQSGVRASETAVVLRSLGFSNVKVYEPSWLGYAGVLNAPAENEVFVNVGALNGQIGSLRARLLDLEAEVTRLQAQARR